MEDSEMETTTGEDTISVTEFNNEGENEDSYSDDETFETNITEGGETVDCTMFRGKPYKDLTFEDLKDVRFDTTEEADKFYLMYSVAKGFSMRKHKLDWNRPKTYVARRELVCCKQGLRREVVRNPDRSEGIGSHGKSANESDMEKGNPNKRVRTSLGVDNDTSVGTYDAEKKVCSRTRRISRRKCPARLTVMYCPQRGAYYPSAFITAHNHRLAGHEHRQFLRSNRKVADHDLAQVISLRKVSVGTARAYEFLVHQAGGHEFVGFMLRDLQNRIQTHHADILMDGDAQSSVTWMNLKAIRDPNFYCIFSVKEKGRLANMFWRNGQSFRDYNMFGDILIFDSTYKTNIYGKPLAVFVGTNNHRAIVMFGCALLVDETEETYDWVLRAFLSSMKDKKPISVISDSDNAIRNAVDNLIPGARHRLCAWHIGKNVCSHLNDEDTRRDFFHLIFAGLTVEEWEDSWQYFVGMNRLENNEWIAIMYVKRERWAEAFFRDHFFGGICSTQRCKGMHRNLKGGIGGRMRLYEVLPRMEKTIDRIRNRVQYDDYKSEQFSPVYSTHMRNLEEGIGGIFSHDVFLLVRDQILYEAKFVVGLKEINTVSGLFVVPINQYAKPERLWTVSYRLDKVNPSFGCSCKLFESDGIPCCHIFAVMKCEGITSYPASLVNQRWTKEPGRNQNMAGISDDKGVQVARYGELMTSFAKIAHIASHSEEGYDDVKEVLSRLAIESEKYHQPNPTDPESVIDGSTGLHPNVIRDPVPCRSKGLKVKTGAGRKKTKKTVTCTLCRQKGHNMRTCLAGVNAKGKNSGKEKNTGFRPTKTNSEEDDMSNCEADDSSDNVDKNREDECSNDSDNETLFHHEEEARTFDYVSGSKRGLDFADNSSGPLDYFRHFRPFPEHL